MANYLYTANIDFDTHLILIFNVPLTKNLNICLVYCISKDLTNLSPLQCLQVAFSAAETHLGISRGTINLHNLANGQEDHKLKSYLQHFKMIHQHEAKRKLRNSFLGIEQDSKTQSNKFKTTHTSVAPPPRPKRATSEAFLSATLPRDFGSASDVRQSISTEHLNSKTATGTFGRTNKRDSFGSNRSERATMGNQYPSRVINPATRHTTTTVERSYSSDIPLPVTIYRTSSRSSIHSTSSRSSMDRSVDDHQLPLTHLANLSSSIIPPHMLPFDGESDAPSDYPSSNVTLDQIFRMVVDFNDQLKEMSQSIDEEKSELEHKLLLTGKFLNIKVIILKQLHLHFKNNFEIFVFVFSSKGTKAKRVTRKEA